MTKLLTIAIPTFNRAKQLDTQLAWVYHAVKGFEADIEIFVSDNCSTDNTQDIIKKWDRQFTNITFQHSRNAENIGVMKNIMHCLNSATTKYVWAIGDDDPIQDRAISYTLKKFKQYDDISLLLLNFSGRHYMTGEPVHPQTIVGNRWFDIDRENGEGDGRATFEHCMTKSVGAVIFLTAIIYRTDDLKRALQNWPDGVTNWMYMAYLAGYCAANGRTIVSKENYLECIVAVSYWQKEPNSSLLMQFKHQPETVRKLTEAGYSNQFYRAMMIRTLKDANLKVLVGAFRRWPMFTFRTLIPFLTSVGRAVFVPASAGRTKDKEIKSSDPLTPGRTVS